MRAADGIMAVPKDGESVHVDIASVDEDFIQTVRRLSWAPCLSSALKTLIIASSDVLRVWLAAA